MLAPKVGSSDARWGEGDLSKLNKEYTLRNEDSDKEMRVSSSDNTPQTDKIISDKVRVQWSTWPVTLSEVVTKSILNVN